MGVLLLHSGTSAPFSIIFCEHVLAGTGAAPNTVLALLPWGFHMEGLQRLVRQSGRPSVGKVHPVPASAALPSARAVVWALATAAVAPLSPYKCPVLLPGYHSPLFVIGDSHVLSLAWRHVTWQGCTRLLVPRLVTGLKARFTACPDRSMASAAVTMTHGRIDVSMFRRGTRGPRHTSSRTCRCTRLCR